MIHYPVLWTHFSQPNRAATPTRAARSSALRLFPFPGAVIVRKVDRICEANGRAGCRAEGKRAKSSFDDMAEVL